MVVPMVFVFGFGFDLGFLLMGWLGFVMGWSGCVTGSGGGDWVVLGWVVDLGKSGCWFCRLDLVATIVVGRKYIYFNVIECKIKIGM